MTSTLPKEHGSRSKPGHGPVSTVNLWHIKPAPENDTLYRPVDSEDPEIVALAESIRKHGLREPIVVSADGYILSGHRRYTACESVGLLEVPVRFESMRRSGRILDAAARAQSATGEDPCGTPAGGDRQRGS